MQSTANITKMYQMLYLVLYYPHNSLLSQLKLWQAADQKALANYISARLVELTSLLKENDVQNACALVGLLKDPLRQFLCFSPHSGEKGFYPYLKQLIDGLALAIADEGKNDSSLRYVISYLVMAGEGSDHVGNPSEQLQQFNVFLDMACEGKDIVAPLAKLRKELEAVQSSECS